MIRSLHALVVAALALAALISGPLAASAAPWEECGPHTPEDEVLRVFPRTPSSGGPAGDTATLECGNRYYGFLRIQPQWAGVAPDWRAVADGAVARTLTGPVDPVYDGRSNTWAYSSPEAVVVLGPGGVVVDARPAGR